MILCDNPKCEREATTRMFFTRRPTLFFCADCISFLVATDPESESA